MAVIQNESTQPTTEKVRPMTASSMTKQPQSWRLVIVIRNRRHRSSRISASGNVQQTVRLPDLGSFSAQENYFSAVKERIPALETLLGMATTLTL